MPPTVGRESVAFRYAVIGVLVLAGVWRIIIAAGLPVLARDGVVFCQYARDLGQQGVAFLRSPDAQQHPLFPTLILATERIARLCGAADTPWTWQRCGQVVSGLAGLAVVALAGALTLRVIRRLQLPVDERGPVLLAMLMAALMDLNIWLSADVMSDQVHLVFYLGAVWLLLKLDSLPAALGCGLCAGLAFLTREEGVVPIAAGFVVLVANWRKQGTRKQLARGGVLLAGFLLCVLPYWTVIGGFSQKKTPHDVLKGEETAAAERRPLDVAPLPASPLLPDGEGNAFTLARLETMDLDWYAVLPVVLYKILRAGRVVIPLLAVLPLIKLRRRLLGPELIGLTSCAGGHLMLVSMLLSRYGYASTRHMLVIVLLLVPFAAILLGQVVQTMRRRREAAIGVVVTVACLLPLLPYALRMPASKDRFLVGATQQLMAHDPEPNTAVLFGTSTTRRIAFYADMPWRRWPIEPTDTAGAISDLGVRQRAYVALELEGLNTRVDQKEREGHRALLARLLADEAVEPRLQLLFTQPGPDNSELQVFALAPVEQ